MSISCIIVEDQPPAQRVLQKYIADLGTLDLQGIFTDGIEAMNFLNSTSVDLVFLDVHLPKISGIELLKIINPKPKVILTTAFSDYALEGYELDIVDYLLKPFSFERFVKAVSKVFTKSSEIIDRKVEESSHSSSKQKFTFVKSGNEYLNLDVNQIKYIKSDGDYTILFMSTRKHLVAHSLKYWIDLLPQSIFCQVHKSYIVNVSFINKVAGSQIMIDDLQIPIGRTYKEHFFTTYLSSNES